MARRTATGAAATVLTATVARRFYLEGKSKLEIADEFALSRFKVARLLEVARTGGMVRIQVDSPGDVDVDLSSRLQARFHLRQCVVIQDAVLPDGGRPDLRRRLGRAGGDLLSEIVTDDDVLGLAWARSLIAVRASLVGLAACTVVQLTGALAGPEIDDSSVDLVRDVARVGGGPAFFFHAPMILPDATTTQAMRTQPEVARAIAHFGSVSRALVGVGLWAPGSSTIYDGLSAPEAAAMAEAGVAAEMAGVQIDGNGEPVTTALTERIIGVDAEQLHRIPEVIGIAYDAVKAPAVLAGIRGGFLDGLVTHAGLATALLGLA